MGLLSIYAATFLNVGWGLSIVYLVLVNAAAHVFAAVLWREYNPGLRTALALFAPLGALAVSRVGKVPGVGPVHHAVGIAVGIGIHAGIVVYTRARSATVLRHAPEMSFCTIQL